MMDYDLPLSVGDPVPQDLEFEVFENGEVVKRKFSDYQGKYLALVFYPADFTFVCPTELGDLADNYSDIKALGGEVVSVSTDTVFVHKAWHDTSPTIKKIEYPMAADPTHQLSHLFGVHIMDEGVSLRGTFIIGPDGVIKTAEIHDNSIGRSAKETLRKMKAAKFTAENTGKVCPASWDEGDDVLKPGLDIVGKI